MKDFQFYIKQNAEFSTAIEILKKLEKAGYDAFIVGGSVRDIIFGNLKPHDIDIATSATPDEVGKIFKTYDIGKSKDFGIVVVKQGGFDFEVATFRFDGKYLDGRRPESVQVTTNFKDDANRRDFTINAMGINSKGDIIDFFGGKSDIKNKILKTVGDPYKRFGEDYLRMMRLARFASKLDFDVDKKTQKAVQKLSHNIKSLSSERIRDELFKSAAQDGKRFAKYIEMLDKLKLLKFILPEVMNLKNYRENLYHHPETRGHGGTVYSHVMAALKTSDTKDPVENLAILLHDIGKGLTLSHKNGLPRYLGHDRKSAKLVNVIADRLKMSSKEKEALVFAVENHMKFHKILEMRPSKIANLVANDNWDVLVAVGRADEYARGYIFEYSGKFEKIVDKAIKIKEKFGTKIVNKKVKLINGKDVMNLTGIKSGPQIGKIIADVTTYIIDNNIDDIELINQKIIELKKEIK